MLDITSALARIHEEVDTIRRRLNPTPDLITFASDDVADRLKRYVHVKASEEEPDTVYISMKVDSGEDVETKYVNLYIDTKRDVNVKHTNLNEISDYIDSRLVKLNTNPAFDNKPYRPYRHFQRRRQNK
jgi:hypothetical protein